LAGDVPLRPYRLTDAEALAALINATRTSEWDMAFSADDVRRWFFDWSSFQPESDSWLAEDNYGTLLGAAHVQPEDPQTLDASPQVLRSIFLFVRPEPAQARLNLARHLLKLALERARSLPRSRSDKPYEIWAPLFQREPWKEELLELEGFRHARSHYTMRRDDLEGVDPPPAVTGVRIETWSEARDFEFYTAMDEAFRDHWGYHQESYDFYRSFYHRPDWPRQMWRMAVDESSGEIAGILVTGIDTATNRVTGRKDGWIHELAVRLPWRRRGVGEALLRHGLLALRDQAQMTAAVLGVDTQNLSGANRIYERAGFRAVAEGRLYSMSL
jgi:ribosomal protein S18 acetylase RimI-like enzyme